MSDQPPLPPRALALLLHDGLRHRETFGGLRLSGAQKPLSRDDLSRVASAGYGGADAVSAAVDAFPALVGGGASGGRSAAAEMAAAGKAKAVLNVFADARGAAAEGGGRMLGEVLTEMSEALGEVCAVVLKRNGHEVDYAMVPKTKAWPRYLMAVEALADATVEEGMDEMVRKGGLYNMYNGLIIHAKLVYGHPTSLAKRGTFFNTAAYRVCGVRVSSPDLEHMVLRCKAADGSPLGKLKLKKKDPRMHFVLNCGARSCPPVRVLRMEAVEEDIAANTSYFINKHVIVNGRKVELSRLWKWFRNDFTPGSTRNAALLAWIAGHAPDAIQNELLGLVGAMKTNPEMDKGDDASDVASDDGKVKSPKSTAGKVRVKFQKYDWADNGDWNAPKDDGLMAIYDASFLLNK